MAVVVIGVYVAVYISCLFDLLSMRDVSGVSKLVVMLVCTRPTEQHARTLCDFSSME